MGRGRSKLCSFPISNEKTPLKDISLHLFRFISAGKLQYGKVGLTMQANDVKVSPMALFKHGLLGVTLLLKTC